MNVTTLRNPLSASIARISTGRTAASLTRTRGDVLLAYPETDKLDSRNGLRDVLLVHRSVSGIPSKISHDSIILKLQKKKKKKVQPTFFRS